METIKIVEYVRSNSIKRNRYIREDMYTTNGECNRLDIFKNKQE